MQFGNDCLNFMTSVQQATGHPKRFIKQKSNNSHLEAFYPCGGVNLTNLAPSAQFKVWGHWADGWARPMVNLKRHKVRDHDMRYSANMGKVCIIIIYN